MGVETETERRPGRMRDGLAVAAAYPVALAAGLLVWWVTGAAGAGFSGADESAHFLNSYFVAFYGQTAFGENPLAFATEFYLHYPKISIGHWPPAYYGLVAPFFLVAPPTPAAAFALNLFVSALPALGVAALLAKLDGRRAAPAGVLVWALTPLALEGQAFLMLDQALAACAVAATIAWLAFAERQSWPRIILFAGLAALAILIKGNGWLLVFVPPLHILLTGRWRLLASPLLYAGAAFGGLLVTPWYLATAGIAADGFNYEMGLGYAWKALAFNAGIMFDNVGPIGFAFAGTAVLAEYRDRRATPGRWTVAAACIALILATLALQSLVPVDIADRYMAPALPPLVVLILVGAARMVKAIARPRLKWAAASVACVALLLPGTLHLAARAPKADLRLEQAAAIATRHPGAWLIDGGSGAEGAFIAAMAVRDSRLEHYTVRGSKLLAHSDFMGSDYRLKFADAAAVAGELARLGVGGIVLAEGEGGAAFAHSGQLKAGLERDYRLAAVLRHRGRPGTTSIYRSARPIVADAQAIRALGLPDKAPR